MQFRGKECIEDTGEQDDRNYQQRAVPTFEYVGRVIQHQKTLDLCTSLEPDRGNECLPAKYAEPALQKCERKVNCNDSIPTAIDLPTT